MNTLKYRFFIVKEKIMFFFLILKKVVQNEDQYNYKHYSFPFPASRAEQTKKGGQKISLYL